MKILSSKDKKIYQAEAIRVLRSGGLVVAPSDTVYGLLVDASNEVAVKKLLAFKNRPIGKPVSVFLSSLEDVYSHTIVNEDQKEVLNTFIPGPFTVILPSCHKTSKLLESERGTLGVRVIDYPIISELVQKFGKPVTATSANISGKHPHHSLESFLSTLSEVKKGLIDLVIDAGTLPRNKPSTVVDLSGSDLKILRKGDILMKNKTSFVSDSANQTKKLGSYLVKKFQNRTSDRPLIFIIEGDLGVGKTILVKGMAENFGIDNIISPTFVIYYEYLIKDSTYKKFIHADLYNIQETEEFKHLGLELYLKEKNILCFEWGERMGNLYDTFRKSADVVYVRMSYQDEKIRNIIIQS